MKTASFSLADLMTLLSAAAFGFFCFLGLNFITEGDLVVSIAVAAGIALLLGFLAWFAKSRKKVTRNFKTHKILEISAIVLYTLLFALASYVVFSHYFTVSSRKQEVKANLLSSIDGATKMFDAYEKYAQQREGLYEAKLHSVVAAKKVNPREYREYGFGAEGISDADQIENKCFTLHADLFPTNYSDSLTNKGTKDVAIKWLNEQKAVVSEWKPIGIPTVSNELASKSEEWYTDLKSYSSIREKGEIAEDFSYTLTFKDVSDLLTEPDTPNSLAIGLAALLWALMLFSWLITKRDSKIAGVGKGKGTYDGIEI